MVIERDLAQLGWIHEQYPDVSTVAGDATLDMRLHEPGLPKRRDSSVAWASTRKMSSSVFRREISILS